MFDDLTMSLRRGETLQQFLKYQSRAKNGSCLEGTPELVNLGNIRGRITPEGQ